MSKTILKRVVLEPQDAKIVYGVVKDYALGQRGFSAAIRLILRDWAVIKAQQTDPCESKEQQS